MDKNIGYSKKELEEWKKWAEEYDSSAGEKGTDELIKNYKSNTPGETADNERTD
tara:strand:+ start:140 stop:301 length:162 start_codon:yes stop_codon:yes gene_type:complete